MYCVRAIFKYKIHKFNWNQRIYNLRQNKIFKNLIKRFKAVF